MTDFDIFRRTNLHFEGWKKMVYCILWNQVIPFFSFIYPEDATTSAILHFMHFCRRCLFHHPKLSRSNFRYCGRRWCDVSLNHRTLWSEWVWPFTNTHTHTHTRRKSRRALEISITHSTCSDIARIHINIHYLRTAPVLLIYIKVLCSHKIHRNTITLILGQNENGHPWHHKTNRTTV